jgi:hypothetical protein
VTANINYYLEVSQGGTEVIYPGTARDKLRKYDSTLVKITDLRSCEEDFTLDIHGFQLVPHASVEKDFDDQEIIKTVVYQEIEDLLKRT